MFLTRIVCLVFFEFARRCVVIFLNRNRLSIEFFIGFALPRRYTILGIFASFAACPGKGKQFQDQEDLSDKVQRYDQTVAEIRLGRGAFLLTFLCVNRIGNRAEKEKSNTSGNRRIVWKRKNGCASGLENSRDLRNSTVKTVQTMKPIGAGNVIKRIIVERDLLIKIALKDFLFGNLTQVRLNITAENVVAE